jgi:HAD superfamily hydrolase (TIGR01457 family)
MRYRAVLFDLDGTLYRGSEPIPGAAESIHRLAEAGAQIGYVTNNSTQTRSDFAQKLTSLGFPASEETVIGTAHGAAVLAKKLHLGRVAVVGESGLRATLAEAGIHVVPAANEPDGVICGLDRDFTYAKLTDAMLAIRNGAKFIATNRDATYPMPGGLIPGSGTIIAAITTGAEVEPIVVGKPNPTMIHALLDHFGVAAEDCLMVGDRIDTDIASGQNAGCDVHLVLTGIEAQPIEGLNCSPTVVELIDRLLA